MLLFRSSWARRTYDIAVVVSYGVLRNTLVGNTQQLRTYVRTYSSTGLRCVCNIRHYWQNSARSGKQAIGGLVGERGLTAALEPSVIGQGGLRDVHVRIVTWQNKTSELSYITTYLVLYCGRSIFNPLYYSSTTVDILIALA